MSKKKTRKKGNATRLIVRILCIISIFIMGFFIYQVVKSNLLPGKILAIVIATLSILKIIYIFIAFKFKSRKWLLIMAAILSVFIMGFELFVGLKLNETMSFLKRNLTATYDTNVYYVVVNKDSEYKTIEDIEGKTIYYYKDLDDTKKLERTVKKKTKAEIKYTEDQIELYSSVLKDNKKIILINSGNYDAMVENDENYEKNTRILKQIEIKEKAKVDKNDIDVTSESFIVYLAGIDTRSGKMPSRSLTDVNMYVVINPNTNKILMVHIPRDYYVQIHGTTGLKDKLTHAGSIGGINLSRSTIEDFMGYKSDYYVRVNFNSVIRLVDAIGGINLYNDQNYSFSCWTDRSCIFKPGNNFVKGKCALAFARERHAYAEGDKHRGENQEQVIQRIVEKVSSSKTLASNYSNILKALNGTFESSLSTDDVTALVKMQIDDMPSWTMETANLDGKGGMSVTHSYPNQKLSVMYPDEKSIEAAKAKIKAVLEEE